MPDDPRYYMDFTGTGNTLNAAHPQRAAADHGLAALLGDGDARRRLPLRPGRRRWRASCTRSTACGVLRLIHQDPVLRQVKLIAEPWDVGAGRLPGRQLPGAVERVERQVPRRRCATSGAASAGLRELAYRLTGLAPTSTSGRPPARTRRINFVTAHDGFTLHDLVTYNEKHNEANGEDNRDGDDDNRSWNCGVEGATDDPEVIALRAQPAAQLPRHAAALPGRADAARRRRDRPHPARQQQRLLPGQRALLVRLGGAATPSCSTFTRAAHRAPPRRTRCSAAATS